MWGLIFYCKVTYSKFTGKWCNFFSHGVEVAGSNENKAMLDLSLETISAKKHFHEQIYVLLIPYEVLSKLACSCQHIWGKAQQLISCLQRNIAQHQTQNFCIARVLLLAPVNNMLHNRRIGLTQFLYLIPGFVEQLFSTL